MDQHNGLYDQQGRNVPIQHGDPAAESPQAPARPNDDPEKRSGEGSRVSSAEDVTALREQVTRLAAETENLRKQRDRQVQEARRNERLSVLRPFLDVVDSVERALAAHEGAAEGPWMEGLRGIYQQLLASLNANGVQPMDAAGELFDPNLHEAVGHLPTERLSEGLVAEVVQRGYLTEDGTLVRPARVLVSTAPS
mgnify:CR=1 FL=1